MTTIPDAVIALLGAAGGGGSLKLLEVWLGRAKQKTDDSKQFRDELKEQANALRTQVEALKDEIKEKEQELDVWKERYWKLYVEHSLFQASVNAVLIGNGINPEIVLPKEDPHA